MVITYVATASFWARRFLENAYFETSCFFRPHVDPILDKKVKQSTFRILERQHLYQKNIISSGPETCLRTWGTLWGFVCSNP